MSTETVITASSPTPLTEVFQLDSSNVSHCILDYHKVYYVKKFMFMFQLSISYRNTPPRVYKPPELEVPGSNSGRPAT